MLCRESTDSHSRMHFLYGGCQGKHTDGSEPGTTFFVSVFVCVCVCVCVCLCLCLCVCVFVCVCVRTVLVCVIARVSQPAAWDHIIMCMRCLWGSGVTFVPAVCVVMEEGRGVRPPGGRPGSQGGPLGHEMKKQMQFDTRKINTEKCVDSMRTNSPSW
jgi:hypothetical protein